MKQKLNRLGGWSVAISVGIFVLSYFLYHFLTDSGFTPLWQPVPGKPFVTLLFSILGVLFLFAGLMSFLAAAILFPKEK